MPRAAALRPLLSGHTLLVGRYIQGTHPRISQRVISSLTPPMHRQLVCVCGGDFNGERDDDEEEEEQEQEEEKI